MAAVRCLAACTPADMHADDVEVTGIVRAQWRLLFPGARCDGTLTLHACHMRTVNSLHRAVAPPPEGLAEQFRCVTHLGAVVHNGTASDVMQHHLYADACALAPCLYAGTSGSSMQTAHSRAATKSWQASAPRCGLTAIHHKQQLCQGRPRPACCGSSATHAVG